MRNSRIVIASALLVATTAACSASLRSYANVEPATSTQPGAAGTALAPQSAPPLEAVRSDWVPLNLLDDGIDAVIAVPHGAIVQDAVEGLRITRGAGFAIEILPGPTDIATQRTVIQTDTARKFIRFHTDSEDTLVYETASDGQCGGSEFHFVTSIETGGRTYTCQDTRTHRVSLPAAVAMVRSCWSLTQRGDGLQ